MSSAASHRRTNLTANTVQGKAAQLTVGACLAAGGLASVLASWDELSCVAGEYSSSGPCGIGITLAGAVFPFGAIAFVAGILVFVRGLRRPVALDGGDGWRIGQGLLVVGCGIVMGFMIPRYACPPGMDLSPIFRFCTSVDRSFQAPSPGLPWKFAAVAAGTLLGVILIRWRSLPWPVASAIAVIASAATVGYTLQRTIGIPL